MPWPRSFATPIRAACSRDASTASSKTVAFRDQTAIVGSINGMASAGFFIVLGCGAIAAGVAACTLADAQLGDVIPSPPPPLQRVSGACHAQPSQLSVVPGLESRFIALDAANLYVLASAAGDPTHDALWRIPLRGAAPTKIAGPREPHRRNRCRLRLRHRHVRHGRLHIVASRE